MTIPFGKYEDWEIEDLFYENPDYLDWFLNNVTGYRYLKDEIRGFLYPIEKNKSKIESEIILALEKNGRTKNRDTF